MRVGSSPALTSAAATEETSTRGVGTCTAPYGEAVQQPDNRDAVSLFRTGSSLPCEPGVCLDLQRGSGSQSVEALCAVGR